MRYEGPALMYKVGGQILSKANISRLSMSERLQLSPMPVSNISLTVLNLFSTPQSVIDALPSISRHLFGVEIKVT